MYDTKEEIAVPIFSVGNVTYFENQHGTFAQMLITIMIRFEWRHSSTERGQKSHLWGYWFIMAMHWLIYESA